MSVLSALVQKFREHGNRLKALEARVKDLGKQVGPLTPAEWKALTANVNHLLLEHTPIVPYVYTATGARRLVWGPAGVFDLDTTLEDPINVFAIGHNCGWPGCFGLAVPCGPSVGIWEGAFSGKEAYLSVADEGMGFRATLLGCVDPTQGLFAWSYDDTRLPPEGRKGSETHGYARMFGSLLWDTKVGDRHLPAYGTEVVMHVGSTLGTPTEFHFYGQSEPVYDRGTTYPGILFVSDPEEDKTR